MITKNFKILNSVTMAMKETNDTVHYHNRLLMLVEFNEISFT